MSSRASSSINGLRHEEIAPDDLFHLLNEMPAYCFRRLRVAIDLVLRQDEILAGPLGILEHGAYPSAPAGSTTRNAISSKSSIPAAGPVTMLAFCPENRPSSSFSSLVLTIDRIAEVNRFE